MATTTTSTTTYQLSAYRYQQDKPGIMRPNVPKDEWRIYQTNAPSSLRVVLEVTKTSNGSYASVRMKVLDVDATRPGGRITLDDIDFLDFSGPEVAKLSSPLKAVWGGKQLGFRYLHPLMADASSQYHKRFQLTFASIEDASALVASIRHVCPTSDSHAGSVRAAGKFNTIPKPAMQTIQQTLRKGTNSVEPTMFNSSPVPLGPNAGPQVDAPMTDSQVPHWPEFRKTTSSPAAEMMDIDPKASHSLPRSSMLPPSQYIPGPSFSQGHEIQRPILSSRNSPLSSPMPSDSSFTVPRVSPGGLHQATAPELSPQDPSSYVPSTQPDIYKLSSRELETLVAKVVHEPGFTGMMENLSKMFALGGFIRY